MHQFRLIFWTAQASEDAKLIIKMINSINSIWISDDKTQHR